MSSLPERFRLDAINQHCYDNCYKVWDRFPFPDLLPKWILSYHDPLLGRHVLDIGSGTGQLAHWLQSQGFEVLGLDPSPIMVKQCQSKGIKCRLTTFQEYHEMKTFSMVLAILSFIHIPKNEWSEQLEKVAKLLPHKGLFILALIEGHQEAIQESASTFPRFFAYFTKEEILKLTQKDFELVHFTSCPGPTSAYLLFALRKR
jgi:2-polyprenyl-3-methyl-5-hydroxy-6-metoxy-1,4-benzoquinol methylase